MRPIFADPKIDLVFKRIFGTQAHKGLLIALLNDLLGLDEAHRIVDLEYLPAEQVAPINGRKLSIVDVKCTDARGTRYVVEMQVLNVEAFEKRLVYNLAKAYTGQLGTGEEYPRLNDVVAVAICDFVLWPQKDDQGLYEVGMLSRWRMIDELSGQKRLAQMRYVVLELPKYRAGTEPRTTVDHWAYFFRETERLREVPKALSGRPFAEALEVARTSTFTADEWEAYDRAKIAEQDARGALTLAQKEGYSEGEEKGMEKGLRQAILDLCEVLGIERTPQRLAQIEALPREALESIRAHIKQLHRWPD